MNNYIMKYEVYLSSNGVMLIEDLLDTNFANIDLQNLKFKTIIVMLCGCLWEKNKLSLEETANLFDEILDNGLYDMKSLSDLIGLEVTRYSKKLKKPDGQSEDKKK